MGILRRSRGFLTGAALAVIATAWAAPPARGGDLIISTFDTSTEGWTSGPGGTVQHIPVGGNPGGYLRWNDTAGGQTATIAPAAFRGDLSAFLGGIISFDALNLSPGVPINNPGFGIVTITGPGGTATRDLAGAGQPPNDGLWHTYSAPLVPALWSGNLAGALNNVTNLTVVLEWSTSVGADDTGMDNFAIAGPAGAVPEPSALVLWGLGLAGLSGLVWRRVRSGRA
jgi:hypothetical protein